MAATDQCYGTIIRFMSLYKRLVVPVTRDHSRESDIPPCFMRP